MIYLSHRGNIDSINKEKENSIKYIEKALDLGFDVEIDLRILGKDLYLGHDYPQYKIKEKWVNKNKNNLLLHLKDFKSLNFILDNNLDWHYFCHSNDPYTITSQKLIWVHDLNLNINEKCIVPLLSEDNLNSFDYRNVYGVCSDFIKKIKI